MFYRNFCINSVDPDQMPRSAVFDLGQVFANAPFMGRKAYMGEVASSLCV